MMMLPCNRNAQHAVADGVEKQYEKSLMPVQKASSV
jgi:hypothetical protein